MSRRQHGATVVVGVVIAATASGILSTAAFAAGEAPPRPPGWVSSDGSVDGRLLPARVPVVGPDGRPVVDGHGRLQQWDARVMAVPAQPGGRGLSDGMAHRAVPDRAGTTSEQVEAPARRP